jgi:hypothetical protein
LTVLSMSVITPSVKTSSTKYCWFVCETAAQRAVSCETHQRSVRSERWRNHKERQMAGGPIQERRIQNWIVNLRQPSE